MKRTPGLAAVVAAAHAPRPLGLLLLLSVGIGVLYAATILDLPFVLGTAAVWQFPQGTVPGSANDMANSVVGYYAVLHAPWTVPLLFAPTLDAPRGLSAFWLDTLPWVALGGKLVFAATGRIVNLLGVYLLACLALNGVALTLFLAAAGQRSLIGAAAGSVLALSTPWLLFRWGHPPMMAQFELLLGLALYVASLREGGRLWIGAAWLGLVLLTLMTNTYLFAMVGAAWAASLIQRWLNGAVSTGRGAAEAGVMFGTIAAVMALVGMIPPSSASVLSSEYGLYGLNLLAPFVPQMSGLVPPLSHYYIGQYEGFSYPGGGLLLLVVAGAWDGVRWLRRHVRCHAAGMARPAGRGNATGVASRRRPEGLPPRRGC